MSGAAGLVFELVWVYRGGLVFGNSIWATSVVLSSFMGGLALGGALAAAFGNRIHRLLLTYAWLEVLVAVSGLAVSEVVPLLNVSRFGGLFALFIVPATAMGATLPVLVAALCRIRTGFGRGLGWLYGWNTLGAVAGVSGAEFFLIGRIGISGTAWVAALFSASAAAAAVWMSGRTDDGVRDPAFAPPPEGKGRLALSSDIWWVLACAFLAGAGLMAFEIIWFRFLSGFVIVTTAALSLMLAAVLAAIAAGALVASWSLRRKPQRWTCLPAIAFTTCCVSIASYQCFQFIAGSSQVGDWYRVLSFAAFLTGATSFLSGVLFTYMGEALKHDGTATSVAGRLALWNTTGGMCGVLVATFVLLPGLGMERSIFVLSLAYVLIGLLAWRMTRRAHLVAASRMSWATAGGATVLLAAFPFGLMSDVYFTRAVTAATRDGSQLVATREGPTETILLLQRNWMDKPLYQRLFTNGFSMTATTLSARRYMRYFVYWPAVVSGQPIRRVLVICYGAGVTVAAATDVPSVESIDVVELSPDMVAIADSIYAPETNPLRDPRVNLHIEDGRHFLQTTAERFDLITGEPPPPPLPGTATLYSREYFQLMRERLNEGGIATYWLPVARSVGYDTSAVIRAFCDVFDDCSLWNGTPSDLMLVGTRRARPTESAAGFSRLWSEPGTSRGLLDAAFELPAQIGATFLGDAEYLRNLTAGTSALTDNYPHRILLRGGSRSLADFGRSPDSAMQMFREVLDPDRARRLFESSDYIRTLWPRDLATDTLPFFEYQGMLNRLLLEGGNPLLHIEDLHAVLTRTPLRRLPLWMLGSDDVQQNIAETATDATGRLDWVLGVRALAGRDYLGAAEYFARAEQAGLVHPTTRPLLVYALCLGGRLDAARRLAAGIIPTDPDSSHYWTWLNSTFGVATASPNY